MAIPAPLPLIDGTEDGTDKALAMLELVFIIPGISARRTR
jgi:hypothetical protein